MMLFWQGHSTAVHKAQHEERTANAPAHCPPPWRPP
jgi:hypothetical protein